MSFIGFLWDATQQVQIGLARAAAADAPRAAREAALLAIGESHQRPAEQVNRLALLCRAM